MSKYNVGVYIRLSRDESYSDSDSIDNQIKLADYYCKNNATGNYFSNSPHILTKDIAIPYIIE